MFFSKKFWASSLVEKFPTLTLYHVPRSGISAASTKELYPLFLYFPASFSEMELDLNAAT